MGGIQEEFDQGAGLESRAERPDLEGEDDVHSLSPKKL